MRNRWGIELKKGYHAWGAWGNRQQPVDGTIVAIDRTSDYARAYGAQVTINSEGDEITIPADSINQVLPPMRVGRGGVVRANPTPRLTRYDQPSQRERINPKTGRPTKTASARLKKRRVATHYAKTPGVWANPLSRVKVKSPSQRTGELPSSRLVKRRKTTNKAPEGFYANPTDGFLYVVHRADANGKPAYMMAAFRKKSEAIEAAKKYANGSGTPYVIEKKPL